MLTVSYGFGFDAVKIINVRSKSNAANNGDHNCCHNNQYDCSVHAQYTALSALLDDICTRNSIPKNRSHVIGHDEYNPAKNDPGELFDWSRIGISG